MLMCVICAIVLVLGFSRSVWTVILLQPMTTCSCYVGRYLFTIVSYLIGVFVFATIVGTYFVVT